MVKLLKIKEEILKAAEKKETLTGIKIRISAEYSSKQWNDIFKEIKSTQNSVLSE